MWTDEQWIDSIGNTAVAEPGPDGVSMMTDAQIERTRIAGTVLLGPDGPIAKRLQGYQARRPQIDMANLVGETIIKGAYTGEGYALIEAGTGTGKSLAYLVAALESGRKVVISTDTIALQAQLIQKDLPFLEEALGRPILYAIAKGKSNYFCERNAKHLAENTLPGLGNEMVTECLRQFRRGDWDGDKANLRLPVLDSQWPEMAGDDTCEGKACRLKATCPLMKAKEELENADIIIANHTIVLLHHFVLMRTGNKGILPEHTVWIADEGHTLADKAQDVFGVEISQFRPLALVKRLQKQAGALDIDLDGIDLEAIEKASAAFFKTFYGAQKDQQLLSDFPLPVQAIQQRAMEALVETLKPVQVILNREQARIPMFEQERRWAVGALADSINLLIDNLRAPFREATEYDVCYVELTEHPRDRTKVATLHRKPAEAGGIFRNIIRPHLDTFIVCSATLAVGNGTGPGAFQAIASELGFELDKTATLRVESPFNYAANVVGYLSNRVPETRDPLYHQACAKEVLNILHKTQGRAFVLFTSLRDMKRVYDLVSAHCRYNLLMQGQAPKDELIRQFKETPNSVLFAVKTFWTGVDIPGEALSCVIICKLPFPSHDHPLVKARCQKIEERGGNGFMDYHLPRCIRDVQQGFGRLIRTHTDTGMVCFLDPRISTARYGKIILNSLPAINWHRTLPDLLG